jgi:AhpD family alkylhydroperoxidase
MSSSWKSSLDDGLEYLGTFGNTAPGTLAGYKQLHAAGAATDHLGEKTRELICIAVAVTTRSELCILNHITKAQLLGATREEVSEALGVAVAMNAGAAITYAGRALDAFNEFSGDPQKAGAETSCG